MPRLTRSTTAPLVAALVFVLAGCSSNPPVAPPRASCVVGQASVDQCVLR